MSANTYWANESGVPPQTNLITDRSIFTESYAIIPAGAHQDTVSTSLPFWEGTRLWVLARPLSGFAETFAQYLVEIVPGGGSDRPEPEPGAEGVLFVLRGELTLRLGAALGADGPEGEHHMGPGGYAFLAPGHEWAVRNDGATDVQFLWIRKAYEAVPGVSVPTSFVTNENDHQPRSMGDSEGRWATTMFVDGQDVRHDMHVNVVTFEPGAIIPFAETHVMEHGLFVLEGQAVYRLNDDWVEVQAGDFMWLRAFCPQACYAGGPGRFRYLLYKDVNRHPSLSL